MLGFFFIETSYKRSHKKPRWSSTVGLRSTSKGLKEALQLWSKMKDFLIEDKKLKRSSIDIVML